MPFLLVTDGHECYLKLLARVIMEVQEKIHLIEHARACHCELIAHKPEMKGACLRKRLTTVHVRLQLKP